MGDNDGEENRGKVIEDLVRNQLDIFRKLVKSPMYQSKRDQESWYLGNCKMWAGGKEWFEEMS